MTKTIYLAGAVSNRDIEHVRNKFATHEAELKQQGFSVINPVTLIENMGLQNDSWENIMSVCLSVACHADEIHLMNCWQESKGAVLERDTMMRLNKTIVYL